MSRCAIVQSSAEKEFEELIMSVLTIQQIMDSGGNEPSEVFNKVLGGLTPEDELIRKQLPARLLRFDEDETAAVGVISSIRKDRDDEVLLSEGMDVTNYSGIVLWQHDYWRDAIPHATNMWIAKDPPGGIPYRAVAKTQYLTDLSELGNDVYRYRLAEHPLGQSVGFRSIESVRKDQTGYDDVFKDWLPRVKAMLKAEGLKAAPGEFDPPFRFYTKWEVWEYSDVYIGSNVDALQIAVKSGIITNDEARLLVDFKAKDTPEETDQIAALLKRVSDLEAEIATLRPPTASILDFQKEWDGADQGGEKALTIEEMESAWAE